MGERDPLVHKYVVTSISPWSEVYLTPKGRLDPDPGGTHRRFLRESVSLRLWSWTFSRPPWLPQSRPHSHPVYRRRCETYTETCSLNWTSTRDMDRRGTHPNNTSIHLIVYDSGTWYITDVEFVIDTNNNWFTMTGDDLLHTGPVVNLWSRPTVNPPLD